MKYRITCCGKFHFAKYAKYLASKDAELLISHKLSTLRDYPWVRNLWIKEYAFYAVAKLLPSRLYLWAYYVGHFFWGIQLSRAISSKVDVDFFLCHANCAPILENKRYRSIRVAQVVNAHPAAQDRLLAIARSQLPEQVWSRDHSNDYFEKHSAALIAEAKAADYILCPSNFVRDSFVENGFDPAKMFVLPYALDRIPASRRIERPAHGAGRVLRVICVGQIMMRKGQHLLVHACRMLRDKGYRIQLTLVGNAFDAYFNYLRSIDSSFRHIRHLEQDELFKEMSENDLFVLPSFEDGFAVVVTEALGQGVPVVVSRSVGSMEALRGMGCSTFEPGDAYDLAERMESFFQSGYKEELRDVKTWDSYACELLSLLDSLVPEGAAR